MMDRNQSVTRKVKNVLKSNSLSVLTLCGVIGGFTVGILFLKFQVSDSVVEIVALPGELFMRAIFMLLGPLVVTSVISGIATTKETNLQSVAVIIIGYCLLTTTLASLIGLTCFVIYDVPIILYTSGLAFHYFTQPLLSGYTFRTSNKTSVESSTTKDVFLDMIK